VSSPILSRSLSRTNSPFSSCRPLGRVYQNSSHYSQITKCLPKTDHRRLGSRKLMTRMMKNSDRQAFFLNQCHLPTWKHSFRLSLKVITLTRHMNWVRQIMICRPLPLGITNMDGEEACTLKCIHTCLRMLASTLKGQ